MGLALWSGSLRLSPPASQATSTSWLFAGAFRGIAADWLWIRMSLRTDEGKYFEIQPLAAMISTLEPDIPEVWTYQAWNMAYNISILFPDLSEQYVWIMRGIHLLKNEGLKSNPHSALITFELAWFYFHKINASMGGTNDGMKAIYSAAISDQLKSKRPEQCLGIPADEWIAFTQSYGTLDPRNPLTAALFWCSRGLHDNPNNPRLIKLKQQILRQF